MPIALATTARREAQYLVDHLFEAKPGKAFKGVTGASALSVFDYHFATAGLNQFSAKRNDVPTQPASMKTQCVQLIFLKKTILRFT